MINVGRAIRNCNIANMSARSLIFIILVKKINDPSSNLFNAREVRTDYNSCVVRTWERKCISIKLFRTIRASIADE